MEIIELFDILSRGEDSYHQFKVNLSNPDSLAAELIAFTNTEGGRIFVGVDDRGTAKGLSSDDISRINQMISNVSSQHISPAINPITEIITVDDVHILVIDIKKGLNKPYHDKNGLIWVKNGSDKRKATAREELQRLFQESGMVHADITPVNELTVSDINQFYFQDFYQQRYGEPLNLNDISMTQIIENLNLGRQGTLNITGALLFTDNPSNFLPSFIVKAVAFPGVEVTDQTYIDSRNITGKLSDIYQQTMSFILSNIQYIQGEQGVNSEGQPEIPRIVFEELLANAFVHRNYFILSPIKVFIFSDRIEIISPGHLPNNLTIENILSGNSNNRNPVLASFANHILPYRGIGTGILRAKKQYPHIEFIDDRENNVFKCIIKRNSHKKV